VDAAHLIPFAESGNDHPTNGIALCKNHHWAMDRHLIAPTPVGVWKVSRVLIGHRSTGEAELVRLADHPVLPPADEAYRPDPTAMQWRVERLIA
jgi:putative restriction endonuclease